MHKTKQDVAKDFWDKKKFSNKNPKNPTPLLQNPQEKN
jgi:hypothetical protein